MSLEHAETQVTFSTPSSGDGVRIFDPIDRHQVELYTDRRVEPVPADTGQFPAPVDAAATIAASTVTYRDAVSAYVRDGEGNLIAEADHTAEMDFPEGQYVIEIFPPIKLYLRVESQLRISQNALATSIEFGDEAEVVVGARSHHENPAGTITTTTDPADMMAAISRFGSALKTTTPERSYPTLRGHPPLVEVGDRLEIPPGLEPPETGVHLELPLELEYLFEAAPLAFYLGADLQEGDTPALVTDTGFRYPLETHVGFQEMVAKTLKQVFFLDCVTRTEGYYKVDLHERQAVEPFLDLEFEALYDQPIPHQLETYLSVPFDRISEHIPDWKLTTHISAGPEGIETLPFALNELAIVKTQRAAEITTPTEQAAAIDGFSRDGELTRSASSSGGTSLDTIVKPESTDSLGEAWIGDGAPIGATKGSVDAFKNRLARSPTEGEISIAVVLNDPQMDAEREFIEDVYGTRESVPFDVEYRYDLSTAELRSLLEEERDFFHYIGHVDDSGFECSDGKLDARDIERVGADSFFLNACQSYEQGMAMIEAGAIGGVVTLREVINSGAVEVGKTMARLLNRGFPLRAALNLAQGESVIGEQYIVVGDGELAIAQSETGAPTYLEISKDGDRYKTDIFTYPTTQQGMGSMAMPTIGDQLSHHLNSGRLETVHLSESELLELLSLEVMPVIIGSELKWSPNLDPALI